ncbi:MAG: aldo/keto reductase [Chloroflexi bacterium]|nr:MAG: aldo/keto reductase [Chloroflexota bacterium]MBL1193299.1 aldo/keto reductase [Chloroflexota bacterium]NOH10591.1 aldo/keto reductase [Chloroflexota bacterium]
MHYRRLGKSGLKVSEISLGAWVTFGSQIKDNTAGDLIRAAFDKGINFFDNADIYANGQAETVMGEAIKDLPREELVISSKVFWPTMEGPNGRGLSRKHIMESIDCSLQRLGLDYLDLYFCHRYDPDTPIEEVVFTMNSLIQQGKILYWGTSEWRASQIAEAYGIARQYNLIPPTMEQPQYNMFHRERVESELSLISEDLGIGLTVWSPLYSGLLTGKYNEGIPEGSRASMESMAWLKDRMTADKIEKVKQLEGVAAELGITTAQLAIAWLLRRKEVSSVITGATKMSQLEDNIKARDAVDQLSNEVQEHIEEILDNHPEDE